MFRFLFASLLLATVAVTGASAQTKTRAARKKIAPAPARPIRRAPTNINPHTGKPYGAGVSQDVKDGSAYLAPGMPMRRQAGYQRNGGYNDNRTPRPRSAKPANSSLSRDSNVPAAPDKIKAKTRR